MRGKPCNPAIGVVSSIKRWESIRQKALLWKGLDKFGSVHECVDWVKGQLDTGLALVHLRPLANLIQVTLNHRHLTYYNASNPQM